MLRKLMLTNFVVALVPETRPMLRLLIGQLVSAAYLALLLAVRPFRRDRDLLVACAAQSMLVCSFLGGVAIMVCADAQMCAKLVEARRQRRRSTSA